MEKLFKIPLFITLLFFSLTVESCAQNNTQTPSGESYNKDKNKEQIIKSEEQWKKELTPNQFYILREKGTEKPFTGELLLNKEKGLYKCAACGNELFTDEMKFDATCGWPSFDNEINGGKIIKAQDFSHGMVRTEISCARCGGHLGHLFDDGPTGTGKRYCVNSVSLEFMNSNDISEQSENKTDSTTRTPQER